MTGKGGRVRGLLAGAASGVLAAAAFPPTDLPVLAFVALVPLFLHVRAGEGRDVAAPFAVFGLVHFTAGLWWISTVLTPAGPLLLGAVLTFLYVWPVALLLGLLLRRGRPFLLAAPLAVVASDWLRSWLFTGFPWLYLGHTQAGWPALRESADLFGAFGVTFAIALFNAGVAETVLGLGRERLLRALRPAGAGTLAVALLAVYGGLRGPAIVSAEGPRVLLVQGNVRQFTKDRALNAAADAPRTARDLLALHLALTREGIEAAPDADVVVWPETMFPWRTTDEPGAEAEAVRRVAAAGFAAMRRAAGGRPVIFGALHRTAGGEPRNSVFLLGSGGGIEGRYDKLHLVPGSEYIPLADFVPPGFVRWVGEMIRRHAGYVPDLTSGDEVVLFEAGGERWAPLVCYEICYPAIVRDARLAGADVLLNLANYGWFWGSAQPDQALQAAVFRAVEMRRAVVVSANTGISCVVGPRGEVRTLEVGGRAVEVAGAAGLPVPLCRSGSPYVFWGDLPLVAALGGLILAAFAGPLGGFLGRRRGQRS